MELEFNNLSELYERLKPALRTKKNEMNRRGYTYIRLEDIWNYLKEVKWLHSKNLSLYQMVSDVLNVEEHLIDRYLKEKLSMRNRDVYFLDGGN